VYFWEVVEAVRRILLTAVIAVIMPGSPSQLITGFLISTVFAVATLKVSPFIHKDDDDLVVTIQLSTAFTFFVTLLLRVDLIEMVHAAVALIAAALLPLFACLWAIRSLASRRNLKAAATGTAHSIRRASEGFALAKKNFSPTRNRRKVLPNDDALHHHHDDDDDVVKSTIQPKKQSELLPAVDTGGRSIFDDDTSVLE